MRAFITSTVFVCLILLGVFTYTSIVDLQSRIASVGKTDVQILNYVNSSIKELARCEKIDFKNSEAMEKSNLILYNMKLGALGAGTYITYKNRKYIITCAHLTTDKATLLRVRSESNYLRRLILVKIDKKVDLAIYKVADLKIPTIEISDEYPKVGSRITMVGNPNGIEDMFTNGIIAKIDNKQYLITNHLFFGNSGGSIIYRGKLVGVTSAVVEFRAGGIGTPYGVAVNLKTINSFLESI